MDTHLREWLGCHYCTCHKLLPQGNGFKSREKFALSFVVFVYLCVSGRRVLSEVRRTPAHDYLRTNAHYVETIGMKPILWEGLQQGFCFLIRLKTHKTF